MSHASSIGPLTCASRETLLAILETLPAAVFFLDDAGTIIDVNASALALIESPSEEIIGKSLVQLLQQFGSPASQERLRVALAQAGDGETVHLEVTIHPGPGRDRDLTATITRHIPTDNHRVYLVFAAIDVTERKRTREAVHDLIDAVPHFVWIMSPDGSALDGNQRWCDYTGKTAEQIQGDGWLQFIHPADRPRVQEAWQTAVRTGTLYEVEHRIQGGNSGEYRWFLARSLPQTNLQGEIIRWVGTCTDIDEQKRAEGQLKELEQRKDDFISMASHELRNPLTALKLQTTLLRRQLTKQGVQVSALGSMETQINAITRLVEELLDVSKMQAGRQEYVWVTVDLDALLREIIDTMQHVFPSHRLLLHSAAGITLVGDRDRLGQVFTNLLSNAIKYSPGAEIIEIDLSASPEMVTIQVRDHGLGIPCEQRDKIFERFYRAADPGQKTIPGLGMGLYIVAEIVKSHGGTISVDSEVGQGSTFKVMLPRWRNG